MDFRYVFSYFGWGFLCVVMLNTNSCLLLLLLAVETLFKCRNCVSSKEALLLKKGPRPTLGIGSFSTEVWNNSKGPRRGAVVHTSALSDLAPTFIARRLMT